MAKKIWTLAEDMVSRASRTCPVCGKTCRRGDFLEWQPRDTGKYWRKGEYKVYQVCAQCRALGHRAPYGYNKQQ